MIEHHIKEKPEREGDRGTELGQAAKGKEFNQDKINAVRLSKCFMLLVLSLLIKVKLKGERVRGMELGQAAKANSVHLPLNWDTPTSMFICHIMISNHIGTEIEV